MNLPRDEFTAMNLPRWIYRDEFTAMNFTHDFTSDPSLHYTSSQKTRHIRNIKYSKRNFVYSVFIHVLNDHRIRMSYFLNQIYEYISAVNERESVEGKQAVRGAACGPSENWKWCSHLLLINLLEFVYPIHLYCSKHTSSLLNSLLTYVGVV